MLGQQRTRSWSAAGRAFAGLSAAAALAAALPAPVASAQEPAAGPTNSITDVAGIEVGQHTDHANVTGTSVLLMKEGAQVGVDVRGGIPGTVNTDALDPVTAQPAFHGLVLSGGS
ncbi:Peptidase family S58 [Streptoalloteichus hindustanus]|uniref:Peptidase family S58 n=1 Tax=Streptoalloteichus hindustanus TaxID=2017 RepID=A0A1M5CYL5_STRHI|nr:Peptidase family S58 [Streptoalloteichus hindustanus]